MINMTININFFRNTQKGRIDYQELLNYFLSVPGFEITYDDKEVNIVFKDTEFGFQYLYKITKVSQVRGIYKLDPAYLNINFMLCMPLLIPSYAAKEILGFALKVSKYFDLQVYHESYADVKLFNIADLYSLFATYQKAYLEENKPEDKVFYDSNRLNAICKYQRKIGDFEETFHNEVEVNPCIPIIDKKNNEFGICTTFNAGVSSLFVPHFDFVYIKDENSEPFYIRRGDFMKFMEKYLTKIENSLPDLYYIKPKAAKSSKSLVSKLRKYSIVEQTFEPMLICDLLDDY